MINAIKDPEKCPEALEDLMHTTFVHPVDASSLSVTHSTRASSTVNLNLILI
jgi:hypothetical protein